MTAIAPPDSPLAAALRRALPAALLAALTALLVVAVGAPAASHDQLVSAVPAEGAVLEELPERIVLEFSNELLAAAPQLLIRDAAGATVYAATPNVEGRTAGAPFPPLPDGQYILDWSVVSADGHRIEGSIAFTAAAGPEPGTAPQPQPSTAAPAPPLAQATVPAERAGSGNGGTDRDDGAGGTGAGLAGLPPALGVALGAAALGVAAITAVGLWRRRRIFGQETGSGES